MSETVQNKNRSNAIIKAILFCTAFVVIFICLSFLKSFVPGKFERIAYGIIGTIAALLTTILFLRFDKKSFADIELKWERSTLKKFFIGLFVGIVLMGTTLLATLYFSGLKAEVNPDYNVLKFLLVTSPLIPLAFMEELGFRAYPMLVLKDTIGVWGSIFITSILFALYHIVNGWTVETSFLGPAIWGLYFGLAAIYSNGIAMPTGMHYALNLTTTAFGMAGNEFSFWTIASKTQTPAIAHAIDFAKIIPALVLLVVGIVCIALYTKKRHATIK